MNSYSAICQYALYHETVTQIELVVEREIKEHVQYERVTQMEGAEGSMLGHSNIYIYAIIIQGNRHERIQGFCAFAQSFFPPM